MFHGRDLYNLQILHTNREKPTEEQLVSLHNLLKYFGKANYNMAILRSRGDQYKRKLEDIMWNYNNIKNFIEHVEKEYKEEDFENDDSANSSKT